LDMLPHNYHSHVHVYNDFLSSNICKEIINIGESYGNKFGWQTQRHRHYPTTDFPLYQLKHNISLPQQFNNNTQLSDWNNSNNNYVESVDLVHWLNVSVIEGRIFPLLQSHYHLNDISATLEMKDLFLVKYDATHTTAQRRLEMHLDSSLLSFNIALSKPVADNSNYNSNAIINPSSIDKECYRGGGTGFLHSNSPVIISQGSLLLHPSRLYHEGKAVEEGIR
jgi:hypothetical protein